MKLDKHFWSLLFLFIVTLLLYRDEKIIRQSNQPLHTQIKAKSFRTTINQIPNSEDLAKLRAQAAEVHKLRGEIALLRAENAGLRSEKTNGSRTNAVGDQSTRAAIAKAGPHYAIDDVFKERTDLNAADQQLRLTLISKEKQFKAWFDAALKYAENNGGNFPETLLEAQPYLPTDFQNELDFDNIKYNRTTLENMRKADKSRSVILREKSGLTTSDGIPCLVYLFADGQVMLFQE